MAAPASAQVAPALVENSSTPPSKPLSRFQRCQKERVAPAGTLTALIVVRYWSVMFARSGEKADRVPLWAAVVTLLQPQPPGVQIGTVEVYVPSVPLSNPSTAPAAHGVLVAVGVL